MGAEPSQVELSYRHNNSGLFSNHYLNKRLPNRVEFKELEVEPLFRDLQEEWDQLNPEGLKETQTEDLWINPVLTKLGHHYAKEVSVDTPRNVREPDYIFTRSAERRSVLKGVLTEAELSDELAVADAKRWGRDLDTKVREGATLSDTPSLQIDFYLRYSGLDWGVLTNGRLWRLYHKDTSHKLEVFYQVDLVELLQQDDVEAFKYFYLFFRRSSFEGNPSFLDRVLEESKSYEHAVSDDLEDQVYEAMAALSQGFFDLESNDLEPDEDTLEQVHDNSLIVLYRLLFLLFAESRGLLPLETNRLYRQEYSLEHLKKRIADRGSKGLGIADSNKLWNSLKELWRFVDAGQDQLDIPAYNGGLFSPDKHPFLEEYAVGDRHLARAIDLLARTTDEKSSQREFVDYRDLEVRHLGSVYEGLLEYKLRYTDVPLTDDEEEGYTPAEPNDDVSVEAGQVYLVTDKGERKATGSYYTPDYIVQYIVERAVGPVLEELRNAHTTEDNELADRPELVEKVLNVNVLDPAMGSGHFLVEVTDFIARFLVEVAPETDVDGTETELGYWRRRVAQSCVYGVDQNPLAVELAKLSLWLRTVAKDKPLSFLDHHLRQGNSLIGAQVADLPLKTEQTRHYREKEQREGTFFDTQTFQQAMSSATDLMQRIEDIAGDELAQVQEAADLYERLLEEHTKAPQLIADVVLAQEFDLEIDAQFFEGMLPRLRNGTWDSAPQYKEVVEEAEQIADERGFFHWELEFPEVFFGEEGESAGKRAGFDAVVGNPPWVNSQNIAGIETDYFRKRYETAQGKFDLYATFAECGLEVTRDSGLLSYVVSNKFLRSDYGASLRDFLTQNTSIRKLVDFADLPLFGDATNYSLILDVQNKPPAENHIFDTILFRNDLRAQSPKAVAETGLITADQNYARHLRIEQAQLDTGGFWEFVSVDTAQILQKIESSSTALEKLCDTICKGIWTGKKDAFVHSKDDGLIDDLEEELLNPVVDGKNVERYFYENDRNYIIYPYTVEGSELKVVNLEEYPNTFALLSDYRSDLEERRNWGETIIESGKKWYEIWNPSPLLQRPKILVQDISDKNRFALDPDGGALAMDTCYALVFKEDLPLNPWALLALLNSKILTLEFQASSSRVQGGFYRYKTQYLENLSIKNVQFVLPEEEREQYSEEFLDIYRQQRKEALADHSDWDKLVAKSLNFIENLLTENPRKEGVVVEVLARLAQEMTKFHKRRNHYDLDVLAYLGTHVDGPKVADVGDYVVPDDDAPFDSTEDLDTPRIGRARVQRNAPNVVTIKATVRYKPENQDQYETDQYGFTETDCFRAFKLVGVSEEEASLIEHFVPAAVERGKGFADFRDNATPTISLRDRLNNLKIPDISRVQEDLRRYEETKSTANNLELKISFTDQVIDQIVYQLYGLTEAEIDIVEDEVEG